MKKLFDVKKLSAVFMIIVMIISMTACAAKETENSAIRIGGLKGPTSIGMVKLMDETYDNNSGINYEFTIAGSADELTPKLIRGELDVAALPANLASVLYNNSEGKVKLLAINTLGVIYVLSKNVNITSVNDLVGKTVYASGKGSTPEYGLLYILTKNGIDPDNDVNIEWKSEHEEVVQAMAAADSAIGILPQPFVTVARGKVEGIDIALDLTKEWEAIDAESEMLTGVLAVNADFADANPELLGRFLEEYSASVDWVNNNVEDAAILVENADIINKEVAVKAIPYCNIVCVTGDKMKKAMAGYLNVLYGFEPKSIGGKLPDEDFYFISK